MSNTRGRIDDHDLTRPRLRIVGGTDVESTHQPEQPLPRLETITSLQLEKVRIVCDAAADQNVACFQDPAPAYGVALARSLGLTTEAVETVFLGTLLRDIGKLRVSRRVLFGLRFMTERQRDFVRMHVEYSGQICQSLGLPPAVAEVVRAHHERWDGLGYPAGLRGVKAPLEARIVALVDAYDFMTRPRPGRGGLSEAKALRELQRESGGAFDPELVEGWAEAAGMARPGRRAARA
jgi:response regulator RpfG family c-di-GMP phosphodiesterase